MNKSCRFFLALGLLLLAAWTLSAQSAQSTPIAAIEFASSDDVTIIRQGRRLTVTDLFDLPLYTGDQIQTGRGVSLEVRIISNSALLRVTENTAFILQAPAVNAITIQLVYGRIRAKVERLTGNESFNVATTTAVAGVRGTDFAYDFIALRPVTAAVDPAASGAAPANLPVSAMPTARIYCFEGLVEVSALVRTPATQDEELEPVETRFEVAAGTMLEVSPSATVADTQTEALQSELRDFWVKNDFIEEPGVPELPGATTEPAGDDDSGRVTTSTPPVGTGDATAGSQESSPPPAVVYLLDEEFAARVRQALELKTSVAIVGTGLVGLGLGVQVFALFVAGDGNLPLADSLSKAAIAIYAGSLPFLIGSLFINP